MSRLELFLLIVVIGCALSVVDATHQYRQIFIELQRAQSQERQLQQDYAQLQYQQSALSKTSRIETLAADVLNMRSAAAGRTQFLVLPFGAAQAKEVTFGRASMAVSSVLAAAASRVAGVAERPAQGGAR